MSTIRWTGVAPSRSLIDALAKAGHVMSKERGADVIVVCTSKASPVPSSPSADTPWIWAVKTEVKAAAASEAVLRGAYDAFDLSTEPGLDRLIRRLGELARPVLAPPPGASFVARSESARRMLAQVARAAATSMPVLLTGETGSGKEVTARLLHAWSARAQKRFVPINCAAIPNELMEAELFGYSKGAFSGAVQRFDGQLVAGEGGTVFLDEIDDTPLSLQLKLLRVLEDRVVQRLGESEPRRVDFRVVAATNRDLRPLIAAGSFGADFYERLAIVSVQVPPLRERLEDLPLLSAHFIERFEKEEPAAIGRPKVVSIHAEALVALASYPWPGNVRELRNVLFEALVYKRAGEELLLADLPRRILRRSPDSTTIQGDSVIDRPALVRRLDAGGFDLKREIETLERTAVELALGRSRGNAAAAAKLLGSVGRGGAADPGSTLRAMVRRLGVARTRR